MYEVPNESMEEFREDILDWGRDNRRQFKWRESRNPYEIIVAELLLQSTKAETVEPIYEDVLKTYPNPSSLKEADKSEISELLNPLGLQNRRASWLSSIGEELSEDGVPRTEECLLELPGVGKYVANATLCFAYGKGKPVVDRNVIRVYQRVFSIEEDRQRSEELWEFAREVLPEENARNYNLSLLDFASILCRSQSPACDRCFANDYCRFYNLEAD